MTTIRTNLAPIINVTDVTGVLRVEDASDGLPAMKVVFTGGVEATVTRSPLNMELFDVWLPPDNPIMAASVMPNVDKSTVLKKIIELAAKAAATA